MNSLCIPILGPELKDVQRQLLEAQKLADLIEWRIDYWNFSDLDLLKTLRDSVSCPVMFTLRKKSQGGKWEKSEEERLSYFEKLLKLKPEYCDLEAEIPLDIFKSLRQQHPTVQIIASHHDFEKTPQDLESVLEEMRKVPSDFYKIACMCQSTTDALRLLLLGKKYPDVIPVGMGECGIPTRVLASVVHKYWTYSSLSADEASAPGQMLAETLVQRYHYKKLSSATRIFGLIGDPVSKSISDRTHNRFFREAGIDAVYVKMAVKEQELPDFFQAFKLLEGEGLSVTMPLKESLFHLLDDIDPKAKQIGAVNTIVFKNRKWWGLNTDADGALDAIEQHFRVAGEKIVILGAGGSAKAIAYEAKVRGAEITILNRSPDKAHDLAEKMDALWGSLDHLSQIKDYALIINTTPEDMPIEVSALRDSTYAMDIKTIPIESAFLKSAAEKECRLIYGWEMFVQQAVGQMQIWLGKEVEQLPIAKMLSAHIVEDIAATLADK